MDTGEYDLKERAIIDVRKDELVKIHQEFIQEHPELRELLNDFLSSLLLHKPDDVFRFSREYFSKFNTQPNRNKPLALVGPSGVGKSTLIQVLTQRFPGIFEFSVSTTTRNPRPGEQDGIHYHFNTRDQFVQKVNNDEFYEYAEVHGNMYGTSRQAVQDIIDRGKICLLDVDVQGALNLYQAKLDFNCFFIMPRDMKQLEERLRARGTEDENVLRVRLRAAQGEIENMRANPIVFREVITNDEMEQGVRDLLHKLFRYYEHLREVDTGGN